MAGLDDGAAATALVLERVGLTEGSTLLDLGCGLGGPSRMAADGHHAWVTGVDLTPELVDAANALAARVGLAAATKAGLLGGVLILAHA